MKSPPPEAVAPAAAKKPAAGATQGTTVPATPRSYPLRTQLCRSLRLATMTLRLNRPIAPLLIVCLSRPSLRLPAAVSVTGACPATRSC